MRFILKRDDRMQTCYSHCTLKFWQDYIKKLERDRLESDLKEAHDVLANMGNRLQALERNPSVWGLLGFDSTCKSFIFRDGNQWLSWVLLIDPKRLGVSLFDEVSELDVEMGHMIEAGQFVWSWTKHVQQNDHGKYP